jgi:hypothetical protein
MKHSNLKSQQLIARPQTVDQPIDFFQKLITSLETEDLAPKKFLEASYKISLNIARAAKSHDIRQKLIKPSIIDAVATVVDGDAATKVTRNSLSVSSSRHTVQFFKNC